MFRTFLAALVLAGMAVSFASAADEAKKKKKKAGAAVSGTVAKVDADKGVVTVKVAIKKKQFEDKDFVVDDKTTATVVEGDVKKELKASKPAELLKNEAFKVGATVSVETTTADGNTAKTLTVGGAAPGKKKKKDAK